MKYLTRGVKRLWKNDAVKYGKVLYYPRNKDHQDPPIKPSKLFMVELVKPYRGEPYWNKAILDTLKLDPVHRQKIAIVKNTPDVCATLMRVKHLLKITAIDLPEKLPEDLLTNKDTHLHENGKLMIFNRADQSRLQATEETETNVKRFDKDTMERYLRLKWLNPMESNGSRKTDHDL